MTFGIGFTENAETSSKRRNGFLSGKIQIGEFEEYFESSLSYWQIKDYLHQWQEALKRTCFEGKDSALITSMNDPKKANFIFLWVIYIEKEQVFIQNRLLFLDQLDKEFDENSVHKHIPVRATVNDDGNKISEWSSTIQELKNFLDKINNYRYG